MRCDVMPSNAIRCDERVLLEAVRWCEARGTDWLRPTRQIDVLGLSLAILHTSNQLTSRSPRQPPRQPPIHHSTTTDRLHSDASVSSLSLALALSVSMRLSLSSSLHSLAVVTTLTAVMTHPIAADDSPPSGGVSWKDLTPVEFDMSTDITSSEQESGTAASLPFTASQTLFNSGNPFYIRAATKPEKLCWSAYDAGFDVTMEPCGSGPYVQAFSYNAEEKRMHVAPYPDFCLQIAPRDGGPWHISFVLCDGASQVEYNPLHGTIEPLAYSGQCINDLGALQSVPLNLLTCSATDPNESFEIIGDPSLPVTTPPPPPPPSASPSPSPSSSCPKLRKRY